MIIFELFRFFDFPGDPTEALTFEYAQTLLSLLLRSRAPPALGPKILIVGGGIANFTNVAETFKGIIRAFNKFSDELIEQQVQIIYHFYIVSFY
jgi:hypothetical protein